MPQHKRATVADLVAAAEMGAIAMDAEVMTAADVADDMTDALPANVPSTTAAASLPSTAHMCGIPGCRHGASHPEHSQPDRQVKLACPTCGMVIRTTARWIARSGLPVCADGGTFAPAARRKYSRAAVAA